MRTCRRRGHTGVNPRKIEMFCDGMVERSESKTTSISTMATMATISSSNYWTAMALETTMQLQEPKPQYFYDVYGIKCLINPDDETDWQPCEPWCINCGYPPRVCDPYFTKCTGTKVGEWFNEETGKWIEAHTPTTEEERWNQHKFGLCTNCKVGLDDRADFTFNYTNGGENGIMLCLGCDEKLNQQPTQKRCTNCMNKVNDVDILVSTWNSLSKEVVVIFCTKC
jgi:hypothetical protein